MQYNVSNSRGGRPSNVVHDSSSAYAASSLLVSTCNSSFPVSSADQYGKEDAQSLKEYTTLLSCLRKKNERAELLHLHKFVSERQNQAIAFVNNNNYLDNSKQGHFFLDDQLFNSNENVMNNSSVPKMQGAVAELRRENNDIAAISKSAVISDLNHWSSSSLKSNGNSRCYSLRKTVNVPAFTSNFNNGKNRQPPPPSALPSSLYTADGISGVPLPPPDPPGISSKKETYDHYQSSCQTTKPSFPKQFFFDVLNGKANRKLSLSHTTYSQSTRTNAPNIYCNRPGINTATAESNEMFISSISNENFSGSGELEQISKPHGPSITYQNNSSNSSNLTKAVEKLLTSFQPQTFSQVNSDLKLEQMRCLSSNSITQKQRSNSNTSKNLVVKGSRKDSHGEKENSFITGGENDNSRNNIKMPLQVLPTSSNDTLLDLRNASYTNYCWQTMEKLYLANSVKCSLSQYELNRNKEVKRNDNFNIPILASLIQASPECIQSSPPLLPKYGAKNKFQVAEADEEICRRDLFNNKNKHNICQRTGICNGTKEQGKTDDHNHCVQYNFNEVESGDLVQDRPICKIASAYEIIGVGGATSSTGCSINSNKDETTSTISSDTCHTCLGRHCECRNHYEKVAKQIDESCVTKSPIIKQPAVFLDALCDMPTYNCVKKSYANSSAVSNCLVSTAPDEVITSATSWGQQPSVHGIDRFSRTPLGDVGDIQVAVSACPSPRNGFPLWRSAKDEYSSNRSGRQGLTDFLLWGALERNNEWSFACNSKVHSFPHGTSVSDNVASTLEDGTTLLALMRNAKIYEFEKHLLNQTGKKECVIVNSEEAKKIGVQEKQLQVRKIIGSGPYDKPGFQPPTGAMDYNSVIHLPNVRDSIVLPRAEQVINLSNFNPKEIAKSKDISNTAGYREQGRGKKRNTGGVNKTKSVSASQSSKTSETGGSTTASSTVPHSIKAVGAKSSVISKTNDGKANQSSGGDDRLTKKDECIKGQHRETNSPNSSDRDDASPVHCCSFASLPSVVTEDDTSRLDSQKGNRNDLSMFYTPEEPGTPEKIRRKNCSTSDDSMSTLFIQSHGSKLSSISVTNQQPVVAPKQLEIENETSQNVTQKKKATQTNRRETVEAVSKKLLGEESRQDFEFPPLNISGEPIDNLVKNNDANNSEEKSKKSFDSNGSWASRLCSPIYVKSPSFSASVMEEVNPAILLSKRNSVASRHASSASILNCASSSSSSFAISVVPLSDAAISSHAASSNHLNTNSLPASPLSSVSSSVFSFLGNAAATSYKSKMPASHANDSISAGSSSISLHVSSSALSRTAYKLPSSTADPSSHSLFFSDRSSASSLAASSSDVTSQETILSKNTPTKPGDNQSGASLSASAMLLLQHLNPSRNAESLNSGKTSVKQHSKEAKQRQESVHMIGNQPKARHVDTPVTSRHTLASFPPVTKGPMINTTSDISSNKRGSFPGAGGIRHNRKHSTSTANPPPPLPECQYDCSILRRLSRPALIAAANQTLLNRAKAIAEAAGIPYVAEERVIAPTDYALLSNQGQQGLYRSGQNVSNYLAHQYNLNRMMSAHNGQKRFSAELMQPDSRGFNSVVYYNQHALGNYEQTAENGIHNAAINTADQIKATTITPTGASRSFYAANQCYGGNLLSYEPYIIGAHELPSFSVIPSGLSNQENTPCPPSFFVEKNDHVELLGCNTSSSVSALTAPSRPKHTVTGSTGSGECQVAATGTTSLPQSPKVANIADTQEDFGGRTVLPQDVVNSLQEVNQSVTNISLLHKEKLIPLDASCSNHNEAFEWLRYLHTSTGNVVYVNTLTGTILPFRPPSYNPVEIVDQQIAWSRLHTKNHETGFSFFSDQVYPGNAPLWEEPQGFGESGTPRKWVRCLSMLGDVLYKNCSQKGYRLSSGGLFFQYQTERPADFEELHSSHGKVSCNTQTNIIQSFPVSSKAIECNNTVTNSYSTTLFSSRVDYNKDDRINQSSKSLSQLNLSENTQQKNVELLQQREYGQEVGAEEDKTFFNGVCESPSKAACQNIKNEGRLTSDIDTSLGSKDADTTISTAECKAVDYLCKSKMLESIGVVDTETSSLIWQWVCQCETEQLSYPNAVKLLGFMQDVRDVWLEKWFKTKGKIFKGDEGTQEHLRTLISRRLRQMLYQACKYNMQI